ncbi:MAG: FeoB-associated Cys-rich membrane protein [Eubacteriales bacterium]|jgi:hypothetical protein
MLAWITANIGTIIVCAVLAAIVAVVIVSMVRNHKKGKTSCGCGCSGCALSEVCHPAKEQ